MSDDFLIKICGLSTEVSVQTAVSFGAGMIGLVFFEPSPRHVSYEHASKLAQFARSIRSDILVVALTVDADDQRIEHIERAITPDILQLHGKESPARLNQLRTLTKSRLMKAVGLKTLADLEQINFYRDCADLLLLDAKPPKDSVLPGGNGAAFNWSLLDHLTADMVNERPVLLAGGLRTENVAEAVSLCRDKRHITGLDVSSGVETSPGNKDPKLIEAFLSEALQARAEDKTLSE